PSTSTITSTRTTTSTIRRRSACRTCVSSLRWQPAISSRAASSANLALMSGWTEDDVSTLIHARVELSEEPQALFRIVGEQGPDSGSTFVVDGSAPQRVLLGKGSVCGVRLTDAQVSRRHAALTIDAARLRVTDLGSKNGTRVAGVAIVEAL